jgi:murein DD-endopeptidase MepM/ murein hydrolase activator NlpD
VRRIGVIVLAFVAVFAPAFVATAQSQITPDDIAAADAKRRAIGAELESTTAEYEAAVVRVSELEESLTHLGIQLARQEQDLAAARVDARDIAVDRYMFAGASRAVLFDAPSLDEVGLRSGYLNILSRVGTDVIIRLAALEEAYQAQQVRIEEALADQVETNTKLEETAATILSRLEAANADYDAVVAAYQKQEEERRKREEEERLRQEEEERRRREALSTTTTTEPPDTTTTTSPPTSEPPPAGSMACPVNGAVTFTDTWGAPRSGGRTHKGVDMIAARGTPAVAIEAGTVRRMRNGGLGGITVTLTGASGDEYYYAHLDGWADGLTVGQSVAVGELLGYVGNTGNARYTVPHLHFEHHPGGGSAVDPYPLVAGLCL